MKNTEDDIIIHAGQYEQNKNQLIHTAKSAT